MSFPCGLQRPKDKHKVLSAKNKWNESAPPHYRHHARDRWWRDYLPGALRRTKVGRSNYRDGNSPVAQLHTSRWRRAAVCRWYGVGAVRGSSEGEVAIHFMK